MPRLIVNGTPRDFTDDSFPATVAELIGLLGLDAKAVVAEVDGAVVAQQEFSSFELAGGQTVELVQFVGGG